MVEVVLAVDGAAIVVLVVEVLEVAGPRPNISEVAFKPSTLTIKAIITANTSNHRRIFFIAFPYALFASGDVMIHRARENIEQLLRAWMN